MNQQLKRIKNKDLSSLDERLFGNLNKVQTITSTLDNLEKFQEFLLKQIGNFQQRSKTKNQDKSIQEVISQNCQTLRQSILKVVPDLQSSRAKFRQTIFSPLSHSSKGKKDRFCFNNFQDVQNNKFCEISNKSKEQIHKLHLQLSELKQNIYEIKESQKQMQNDIKHNNRKVIEEKICGLFKENTTLKKTINKLKEDNHKLIEEVNNLKTITSKCEKIEQKVNEIMKNELQQEKSQLSRNNSIQMYKQQHMSLNENLIQTPLSETKPIPTYLSFLEKMKLDFTAKLEKNNIYSDNKFEEPSIFRESQCLEKDTQFNSIQLQLIQKSSKKLEMNINMNLEAPNVPRLLRNKSLHTRSGTTHSETSLRQLKHQLPLQQNMDYSSSNINIPNMEPHPFSYSSNHKKTNHDLMRKTKSNFFQNLKNEQENFNRRDIAKINGLQNHFSMATTNNNVEKRSSSKKKLRIFSII